MQNNQTGQGQSQGEKRQRQEGSQFQQGQQVGNPISDLMFDWITVLHNKAEGVNAYDKYLRDAEGENSEECVALLTKLKQQDAAALSEIRDHVAMMLGKSGRFEAGQSGGERQGSGNQETARH